MKTKIPLLLIMLALTGCSAAPTGTGNNSAGTAAQANKYLLASDTNKVTEQQLSKLNETERSYAYEEIFARHGKIFDDENKSRYFNSQSWYSPNPSYNDSMLTDMEKSNAEYIKKYIDSHSAAGKTAQQAQTQQVQTQQPVQQVQTFSVKAAAQALNEPYCLYDVDKDGAEDVVTHNSYENYGIYMNKNNSLNFMGYISSDGPSDFEEGAIYKSKRNGFYVFENAASYTGYCKYEYTNGRLTVNSNDNVRSGGGYYYVDSKTVTYDTWNNNKNIIEGNRIYFTPAGQ